MSAKIFRKHKNISGTVSLTEIQIKIDHLTLKPKTRKPI